MTRWLRRMGLGIALLAGLPGCDDDGTKPAQSAPSPAAPGQAYSIPEAPKLPDAKPHEYAADYEFTEDWFTPRLPAWNQHVKPLAGKPIQYLEVGVFEGRSALWMLEVVLTHEDSRMTTIDPFSGELKARYQRNLEKSGKADKAKTIVGFSQQELKKLPENSFDVIYIDGSHTADDVLADAVLSWQLLKEGGLLIFDDYRWSGYPGAHEPPSPAELRPKLAVDAFLSANRYAVDVVRAGYQLFVKKGKNPCPWKEGCTPVGEYRYQWWEQKLYRGNTKEAVALTKPEVAALEALLRSRQFGQVELQPTASVKAMPGWSSLQQKLKL